MSSDVETEDETYDLTKELNAIDPKQVRLSFDVFEDLTFEMDGKVLDRVTVSRAFPISSRWHFVLLRDSEGEEIGILKDPQELDPESLEALRQELEHGYFTPKITAVHSIEEEFHVPRWDVETNRGPRVFDLRSARDMRDMGKGRLLIRDADGNRYEIPDYRQLDSVSQSIVESRL
jgi:hypothetical protein